MTSASRAPMRQRRARLSPEMFRVIPAAVVATYTRPAQERAEHEAAAPAAGTTEGGTQ